MTERTHLVSVIKIQRDDRLIDRKHACSGAYMHIYGLTDTTWNPILPPEMR